MNIKFTVEYDGTNYHGWQIQKELPTIQGELTSAFSILFPNHKINIIGSGRTDSGVHAYNQVASIKISKTNNLNKLFNSINGIINNDIYIKNYEEKNDEFNARFSAKYRIYKYYISTKYSPFKKNISWLVKSKINFQKLNQCAEALIGEHDFSALSKNNEKIKNKKCIIYESYWEEDKNQLIYTIKGNRFLHHMVRFIIGTSIEVAKSTLSFNDFLNLMNNNSDLSPVCAPSHALFLFEVLYD